MYSYCNGLTVVYILPRIGKKLAVCAFLWLSKSKSLSLELLLRTDVPGIFFLQLRLDTINCPFIRQGKIINIHQLCMHSTETTLNVWKICYLNHNLFLLIKCKLRYNGETIHYCIIVISSSRTLFKKTCMYYLRIFLCVTIRETYFYLFILRQQFL